MIDPMRVLQQAAASLERLDSPELIHRVMDEVEFVFEYLEPEHQGLASELMARLSERLADLEGRG